MKGRIFLGLFATILFLLGFSTPAFADSAPSFPSCSRPVGNAIATNNDGQHGIVGQEGLQSGSDYVYSVDESRVMQCFCGGNSGTQTNFWEIPQMSFDQIQSYEAQGWVYIPTGSAWGLSDSAYLAQNVSYTCGSSSNPSNNSGSNGGSNGSVGGSTPYVCHDSAPTSAPVITSIVSGENAVTLTWTKAGDPVSYYLVAYGTAPGHYQYGNPNVGGHDATSYTITNLSGGTTYYFVVRAGNGCEPGPFSSEVSNTPNGGVTNGIANGFESSVLGQSSPSAILDSTHETKNLIAQVCANCRWWWEILLGEVLAIILFELALGSKITSARRVGTKIALGIIAEVVFVLVNRGCIFTEIPWWHIWAWHSQFATFACRYFWLLALGIAGLSIVVWFPFGKKPLVNTTTKTTKTIKTKKK